MDPVDCPALSVRALLLLVEDLHLCGRHICRHQHDYFASDAVLERTLDVDDTVLRLLEGKEKFVVFYLSRITLDVREESHKRRLRVLRGRPDIICGRVRDLERLEGIQTVVPKYIVAPLLLGGSILVNPCGVVLKFEQQRYVRGATVLLHLLLLVNHRSHLAVCLAVAVA